MFLLIGIFLLVGTIYFSLKIIMIFCQIINRIFDLMGASTRLTATSLWGFIEKRLPDVDPNHGC